jgi:class 3 adenylate cyclase
MDFYDVVGQVLALLQRQGRVSYRALKRHFGIDDEYIADVKEEIIEAQRLARDENDRILVWIGDKTLAPPPLPAPSQPAPAGPSVTDHARDPASYTPPHLVEKILTTRSALEGERKQVTVVFADVAGFSTLAEQLDPESVHTIMDGRFDILTRQVHHYEGTINQFTGDGIMALFGAPITHEDHANRALHAALDIQAAMQDYGDAVQRQWGVPLQMRLGLNTGTVVVGRIGDDLRMDYTAQGDTTNLAARMQQMAAPGGIWVAQPTFRVTQEAFEWCALEPQVVKGRAAPVAVYDLPGSPARTPSL